MELAPTPIESLLAGSAKSIWEVILFFDVWVPVMSREVCVGADS